MTVESGQEYLHVAIKLMDDAFFAEIGRRYLVEDVRFTRKDGTLYAIFLEWPQAESALASLGRNALPGARIERIDLLGGPEIRFRRDAQALRFALPPAEAGAFAPAIRIRGRGLA